MLQSSIFKIQSALLDILQTMIDNLVFFFLSRNLWNSLPSRITFFGGSIMVESERMAVEVSVIRLG